jgi:hypothetical protein
MREHYGLDRLADYATEAIPDTKKLVNPEYHRLDGQVRSKQGHLTRKLATFAAMNLKGESEPKKVAAFEQKKGRAPGAAGQIRSTSFAPSFPRSLSRTPIRERESIGRKALIS